MGRMTKITAAAASALLVLGVAACGDDDEPEATTDTTEASTDDTGAPAEGDNAAFCDAVVEFNSAVFSVDIEETSSEAEITAAGEELAPIFATVAENAPDELADMADELNDAIQPLTEGDSQAFDQDSTFETYTEFVGGAVDSCGFDKTAITAVDYAFEGVPATIPAGISAFALVNESDAEEHEMIVFRRADGVDLSFEEILNLSEEESETKVEFKGAGFAPPGGESGTLMELTPGDYAMVCFIPVGGGEDGPPHFTQGMIEEFTVS